VPELTHGLLLQCSVCGHEWRFQPAIGTIMEAFLAQLNANKICPKCGNHSKAKGKTIMIVNEGVAKL